MVVWFAHVRVGHRQLSILKYPPTSYLGGGFLLADVLCRRLFLLLFSLPEWKYLLKWFCALYLYC